MVEVLKTFMHKNSKRINYLFQNYHIMPNFLFVGESKTGKTDIIKNLVKYYKGVKKEFNIPKESLIDENITPEILKLPKINTIRAFNETHLKSLDFKELLFQEKNELGILVLDDVDKFDKEIQKKIGNFMGTYSSKFKFILTCKDIDKLSEEIVYSCMTISLNSPNTKLINKELFDSAINKYQLENNDDTIKLVENLCNLFYPSIGLMEKKLNEGKLMNDFEIIKNEVDFFKEIYTSVKSYNVEFIYSLMDNEKVDELSFRNLKRYLLRRYVKDITQNTDLLVRIDGRKIIDDLNNKTNIFQLIPILIEMSEVLNGKRRSTNDIRNDVDNLYRDIKDLIRMTVASTNITPNVQNTYEEYNEDEDEDEDDYSSSENDDVDALF